MNVVRRLIAVALVLSFIAPLAAVGSRKAEYIGGTIAGLPERTEGLLDTTDAEAMRFTPEKRGLSAIVVPWSAITSLEYGQKAGRRVAAGVLLQQEAQALPHHQLRLAASKEQAVVLELGKDIIRTSLTVVETRSGKAIEYQDEEARKNGRGGN